MIDDAETALPNGWQFAKLCGIAEVNPRLDKSAHIDNPLVSFVPMPAIEASTGTINVSQTRRLEEVKKGYTSFREGDVLFAKITPCMENGKMAIVPPVKNGLGFGSTEFHVLRPFREISDQYIYYFVSSEQFRRNAQHNMTGAVGQRRVPTSYLADQSVPVPPAQEQRRIVAKIEELFSELDKGVESLKTAREQLKVYREAVLKHAFEGKLTAQWREENKDKLKSPEKLLARINQEREARYGKQLKEWEASGRPEKKSPKPKKPQEVTDAPGGMKPKLPLLPEGWIWARLGNISDVTGGLTKNQKRNNLPNRMKYLRVANVYSDRILTHNVNEIGVTEEEAKKVALEPGDLLIVEGNGSIKQIGRVAMWDGELPLCGHQNHLIRVRLATKLASRFFLQFLLSPVGRDLIVREASSTSGLHTLSVSKVSALIVPLTSLAETAEILAQLEVKLSQIDNALQEVDSQILKSQLLRQAILNKAFTGQLVSQDPEDEPASVLLDRIKAKKATISHSTSAQERRQRGRAT